tara:strand:+ start:661 stop:1374 length:714 start_codon:yes stop_codon:yes gene_type:complete
MARISTYGIDGQPQLDDKVIGTDTGASLSTKNYSLQLVVDLFNNSNSVAVADQSIFLFQSDLSNGRNTGTISFVGGGGVGTAFSAITTVLLSKTAAGNKNIEQYLPLFLNKGILLAEAGNINNFGQYTVNSVVEYTADTNFYQVGLSLYGSNGALSLDKHYIFGEFTNPALDGDKTFIFSQPTPSVFWEVQHNLNKFPSVSVVNNNNVLMYGDTSYIDKNNLTITFSAGFSGKAYIN